MDNLDCARDEFNKVLELSPDYSWAYYNLACIAYKEGNYQEVSEYLDKTLDLNPKDEDAYINYAKFLAKIEMFSEAKAIMDEAVQNCQNIGHLSYYAAQIAKAEKNAEDYVRYLNNAITNKETLSVDIYKVMSELEKFNDSNVF